MLGHGLLTSIVLDYFRCICWPISGGFCTCSDVGMLLNPTVSSAIAMNVRVGAFPITLKDDQAPGDSGSGDDPDNCKRQFKMAWTSPEESLVNFAIWRSCCQLYIVTVTEQLGVFFRSVASRLAGICSDDTHSTNVQQLVGLRFS